MCSTSLTLSNLNEHTFCNISCRCQLNHKHNKVCFFQNVNVRGMEWRFPSQQCAQTPSSLLIDWMPFSLSCELLFVDYCTAFKIVVLIIFCKFLLFVFEELQNVYKRDHLQSIFDSWIDWIIHDTLKVLWTIFLSSSYFTIRLIILSGNVFYCVWTSISLFKRLQCISIPVSTGQSGSLSHGKLVLTKVKQFGYFSINEKYSEDLSGQVCGFTWTIQFSWWTNVTNKIWLRLINFEC